MKSSRNKMFKISMDHFGVPTLLLIVLLVLYKHTDASDYIMEGDMDYNMRIVREIPGILLTDCIFRCKGNNQCEIPGLRQNDKGEMISCLFLAAVAGNETMNGTLVQGNMTKRLFEITDEAKFEKDVQNIKECFKPNGRKWVLQSSKMCLSAKDNEYGEFVTTQGGNLAGVKFEHISGQLMCTTSHSSRWGCPYDDPDNLGLIVTDEKDNAIFPTQYRPNKKINEWYKIQNMKGDGDYLTLFYPDSAMRVDKHAKIRVWFLEDWIKQKYTDNSGKLCVKVFAKYNC